MKTEIFQKLAQGFRAVARFFMFAVLLITSLWRFVRWVARGLLGNLSYQGPTWISAGFRFFKNALFKIIELGRARAAANPRHAKMVGAALVLIGALAVGLYTWYLTLPQSIEASFSLNNPSRTRIEDPKARPEPLTIVFCHSVAPIERVGKEISGDLEISPKIEGAWRWLGDQRLRFTPKNDWPIGVEYKLSISRSLIAEHISLDKYSARFNTAPFESRVSEVQFYQDPIDASAKKVVATVTFSHPVDTADFEKRIKSVLAALRTGGTGARPS